MTTSNDSAGEGASDYGPPYPASAIPEPPMKRVAWPLWVRVLVVLGVLCLIPIAAIFLAWGLGI